MLATEYFGISRGEEDDWFDTILDVDTELFVDPFLIFKEEDRFWKDSHSRLISHFETAFMLIAEGNRNPRTLAYRKALALLEFKEPHEFCLGYTSKGTRGSGSSGETARLMGEAISAAISRGLENPDHFEELGILQKGIGADRISDATCTILKSRFIEYTQAIAKRHNLELSPHKIFAASFDAQRRRFRADTVDLPTNPCTGGALIFVPERFLDELPAINPDDWWDSFENAQLRDDLSYEVLGNVSKQTIVDAARGNMDSVRTWAEERASQDADPYDFLRDKKGVIQWERASLKFTAASPLTIPPAQDPAEFDAVIDLIIEKFKLFVESNRGWYLLWDGDKDKPELAAQLIFYGIARNYCTANNIVVDPESDFGSGPVDFKFSNGYIHRAHLEVKKLHNGKFWNGLDKQLPKYMESDEVENGWFLAIRYREGKKWDDRARELPKRVKAASKKHGRTLKSALVDARPKKPASKL